MTGEQMNKIYVSACLGSVPVLKTKEEQDFYNQLVKEMSEKKDNTEWAIPSE